MAIDICKHVGRRIAEIRTAKGWSQQILADHAELSREHILRVESGQKELGIRSIERIADALECKIGDLFESPNLKS